MLRLVLVAFLALVSSARAQAPPPAPQLEDRFSGWAIQCTIDAVALFPSCVVSAEQVLQTAAESGSSFVAPAAATTVAVQISDASGEPQLLVRSANAASRVGVRFEERIGRYLECSGGVCVADAAAVVNALRDTSGQVTSVYLWLGVARDPWLRFSGIGLLEALDCRRKFIAAVAAGRVTPATSRLLNCQGVS